MHNMSENVAHVNKTIMQVDCNQEYSTRGKRLECPSIDWPSTKYSLSTQLTRTSTSSQQYASRFIVTRAVPLSKSVSRVIQFIEEGIITKFGIVRAIISDNDRALMSRASSDHNEHRHIEQILTAFYTPQTDGLVDIANVQILPPVRKNVDGDIDHKSEYQARTTFEVNMLDSRHHDLKCCLTTYPRR